MKKKLKLVGLASLVLFLLTACGQGEVTSHSTSLWEQLVYLFASFIKGLSFNGQIGLGIVLFTLILRALMMPLYNMQMNSSRKMQDLQPELKTLQAKYAGSGREGQLKLTEETRALQKEHGISMSATWIPLLVQLPILMALYQALTRVDFLREGSFLWLDISKPDSYFVLPILAAVFTFLSSWLTNKAAKEKNAVMTAMAFFMPVMILLLAFGLASGVVLYWTVSNAFQVFQILLLNNPFKIIAEREAQAQAEKERLAKIRRNKNKVHKKRK